MKSILIASVNSDGAEAIKSCLKADYAADVVPDFDACMERFKRRRYEFVFIDLPILANVEKENGHVDFKKALQHFWNVFPTAQIVVLSSQEKIRDAVDAVKAGASNYLTHPSIPRRFAT